MGLYVCSCHFDGDVRRVSTPNRGFARYGMHLYAHDFATPLGFLFVWRGVEKINRKMLQLLIYFVEGIKI